MDISEIMKQVEQMQPPPEPEMPPENVPEHLKGIKIPDIIPIFPKIITAYEFDASDNFELKSFVKDYIENHEGTLSDHGHNLNHWLNTSKQNFFDIDEPIVQKFKSFVSESYVTHNRVMHWDLKPDHFISECWINKTERGGYQSRHSHSNCWISGTYYLEVRDANMCRNTTDSVFILVKPRPEGSSAISIQSQTEILVSAPSNSSSNVYTWDFGDGTEG